MRTLILFATTALVLSTTHSLADSYQTASNLGDVLASEKPCALSYDQPAIQSFIDTHVDADDMEFPGNLSSAVFAANYTIGDMTPSQLTAHCAQIERIARAFRFID